MQTLETMKFAIDAHFNTMTGEEMEYSYLDETAGDFDHYYESYKENGEKLHDFMYAMSASAKYFENISK